jgi:hypothetical protein
VADQQLDLHLAEPPVRRYGVLPVQVNGHASGWTGAADGRPLMAA